MAIYNIAPGKWKEVPRVSGQLNRGGRDDPDPAKTPWELDEYAMGTDSGNMAWGCLLLLNCYDRFDDPKFAHERADWLDTVKLLVPMGYRQLLG